jgi:DNA-binding transcriptional LysR family regulator
MGPFYSLALRAAVEAAAPGIMLTFDTVSRPPDLEENLRDGVVDLAIDWLPVQLDPFVNRKLFDDRLVLLARRGHPLIDDVVTMEHLQEVEFVTIHHRREIEHAPVAIRELLGLGIREMVHVSELLEIPTLVASTDLVGAFAASMGPLMEQRLGLQVLPLPLQLPAVPIYMVWHETRRHDPAHRWLPEVVAQELRRFAPDDAVT